MASADKELEEQLREAGSKLVDPPSSVDELLPLLDQIESYLSRVEQSPTESMQNALSSSLKALIADKLLRHSDEDVKVAVASCISEITRITAPDAPYDDDQMKEVFQLIVSSFENLHDTSSRSYAKRTSIIETVAKVRSCVVMLDLDCDSLIVEMFQHFFKAVRCESLNLLFLIYEHLKKQNIAPENEIQLASRGHHPENVLSSIETIMTLVIEESEDIPMDMLSPILASVKKGNEEFSPNAQNLGERVLESCATKLKPYLTEAVKTLGISLGDYSKVLASICQEASGSLEQNDACASSVNDEDEGKPAKATLNESTQVTEEDAEKATPPQEVTVVDGQSSKLVTSNGTVQSTEDNLLEDPKSLKKQDITNSEHSTGLNIPSNEDPDNVSTEKVDNTEQKPEQATKRRRKQHHSRKLAEPSKGSAEKMIGSTEFEGPSENDKESHAKISSGKVGINESEVVASPSPSPSESHPNEIRSKKPGRANKRGRPAKEVVISSEDVTRKSPEVTSDSKAKRTKRGRSAKEVVISSEDVTRKLSEVTGDSDAKPTKKGKPAKEVVICSEDVTKKSSEVTSDSDAKPTKRSAKKAPVGGSDRKKSNAVDSVEKTSGNISDSEGKRRSAKKEDGTKGVGSSSRKLKENKKKQAKVSDLDVAKSAKDEEKETVSSPKSGTRLIKDEQYLEETLKTNSKRKTTPGKENKSDIKVYGENLVGSRVEVWWPDDREFYIGTIESFDSAKKKHKVAYDDGDIEILNLRKEIWKTVQEGDDHASPDVSADLHSNKRRKKSAGQSVKGGNTDTVTKSGGAASSKSKGESTKSGHKLKDGSKVDSKSKDSKSIGKSEDGIGSKSKDHVSRSGSNKSAESARVKTESSDIDAPKTSKSKNDDISKPKFSSKTKQETPQKPKKETSSTPASKGRPPRSRGKSSVNASGKIKSGSSKKKDAKNELSADSTEKAKDTKGKASSSSKAQGTAAKAGKKRRRG